MRTAAPMLAICSCLMTGSAAAQGVLPRPPATLGPGSVAEFNVQRLVSTSKSPSPSDRWQQIHETRTVLSQKAAMLEIRIEEDFGPGTQPTVRTEIIAAVPELPAPATRGGDARTGDLSQATGPDGLPRRTWVGRETVTTLAGTFPCVHIAVEIVQMSSGTHIDEWYAAGLPWPVRSSSVTGAGATHYVKSELVKLQRK
jgi:hypothetical protein